MSDVYIRKNRYPGPRPFGDNEFDRSLFFGRERESKNLLHLVVTGKIVVLHSPPGMGKTSLINAGLNQKLREGGFLPIPVRFHLPLPDLPETPQPVLIIDAFEELFAHRTPRQAADFAQQLIDLASGRLGDKTAVKVLIAIDDPYLGQLEGTFGRNRTLLADRLELHGLDKEQTIQAITGPASLQVPNAASFTFSKEAAETMADFLCNPRETRGFELTFETQPFQLQLLCRTIEENAVKTPHEKQVQEIVPLLKPSATVNTLDYYRFRLKQVPQWRQRRKVRRLIETGLIRNEHRVALEKEEIGTRFKVDGKTLDRLEQGALLQKKSRENGTDFELSHLLLVEPILTGRARRRNQMLRTGSLLALLVLLILVFSGVLTKIPGPWSPTAPADRTDGGSVEITQNRRSKRSRTQIMVDGQRLSLWDNMRQGRKALANKQYDEALKIGGESIRRGFSHAALYHLMALAYLGKSDTENAIVFFNEALSYDPGLTSSAMGLGRVYEGKKAFNRAVAVYTQALAHDRRNSELIKALAVAYVHDGQPEKAIDVYRDAIQFNRNNATIYKEIFQAMKEGGYNAQMETLFKLAAGSKIRKPFHYFNLGRDLLAMGKHPQAEKYFEKAVDMLEGSALSHIRMGYEFIRLKRYSQALALFEKATRLDPKEVRGYSSIGNAYYYLKKFDEAVAAYRRAATLAPGYQWNYYNLGLTYYQQKNYRESAEAFKTYVSLNPKTLAAHLLLGDALMRLEEYEPALEAYREAVNLEPNGIAGNVRLAESYWITGNYPGAVIHAGKVLKIPDIPAGDEALMRFVESSGLMLTGKKREAVDRMKNFSRWYKSLKEVTTVSFIGKKAHEVLKRVDGLEARERRILHVMWNVLASSRAKGLDMLNEFETLLEQIV